MTPGLGAQVAEGLVTRGVRDVRLAVRVVTHGTQVVSFGGAGAQVVRLGTLVVTRAT